jgi:septum site-determining protein MinD
MSETVAFVGAAGGAGTSRLTLACAELLARDGRDTVVLDAAYGTQGLADRIEGEITPDMTELCLKDAPLESGLIDQQIDGGGRLSVCPARAPFSRLAEAKTPEAAERFETRIGEATRRFKHVLIDTPPIAANQATAAATSAETVALVCDGIRAETAVPRMADRLHDIGIESSTTVVTRMSEHLEADVCVPTLGTEPPVIGDDWTTGHDAIANVLETVTGTSIEREQSDGVLGSLPFR